jgi:hypothetical protein
MSAPSDTFQKDSPTGGSSVYGGDNSMQGTKSIETKSAGSGVATDSAKTRSEAKSGIDMKNGSETQPPAAPKSTDAGGGTSTGPMNPPKLNLQDGSMTPGISNTSVPPVGTGTGPLVNGASNPFVH